MTKRSGRLPRFRRAADAVPPFVITARDTEILGVVGVHRFVRSAALCRVVDGSDQQIRRRLRLLFHHGYLERPLAQLDSYYRTGSRPMVYGLASKGAALLRSRRDMAFSRIDWTSKNRRVKRIFLDHALLVSDFLCGVEAACRAKSGVRFISRDELLEERVGLESFRWSAPVDDREVVVAPDSVFALEVEGLRSERHYYFLEADRGTMPLRRSDPAQSSFERKLLAYSSTWKNGIHRDVLGFHRFRVLTITSSPERLANMVELAGRLLHGRGLFLFRSEAELAGLDAAWTAADGRQEDLLGGEVKPE